jgi:glycosyltransferase involved in cell wall biosynthesis
LSNAFSGAVISTKWRNQDEIQSPAAVEQRAATMRRFSYHPIPIPRIFRPVKFVYFLVAFTLVALYLHFRRRKFDAIVAYGPYTTALAGYVLKRILGIKLVLDIPGDPFAGLKASRPHPRLLDRLKIKWGRLMVPALLNRADHLKLLYPGQLEGLIVEDGRPVSYFADFTAVSNISRDEERQNYLLFVGHPWYLKGVDLLIPAFLSIAGNFPSLKLRLVGWCPNRDEFERLAAGDPRIEFYGPLPNHVVKQWMAQCIAFILASRTEGTPRVLLEAMAAKAPIIASRVGGIPHLIEDEKCGLLFESGNYLDLSRKIERLLEDENLRASVTQVAFDRLQQQYLEKHYFENYVEMIDRVLQGSPRIASSGFYLNEPIPSIGE